MKFTCAFKNNGLKGIVFCNRFLKVIFIHLAAEVFFELKILISNFP